jgi:hypothetical protein
LRNSIEKQHVILWACGLHRVEDRRGGDDQNELIFHLRPLAVPAPEGLGLFGCGVLALALAARRGAARALAQRAH